METTLTFWRASFGVDDGADADGDGDTDGADLMLWQRNFSPPKQHNPRRAGTGGTGSSRVFLATTSVACTAHSRKTRPLPADA